MVEIELCLANKLNEHIVGEIFFVVENYVVPLSGNEIVYSLGFGVCIVAKHLGLSSREGIEGYINLAVVIGNAYATCSAAVEACSFDVNNLVTVGNLYFLYRGIERIRSTAADTPCRVAFVDALAVLGTVDCNHVGSKVGRLCRVLGGRRNVDGLDGGCLLHAVV